MISVSSVLDVIDNSGARKVRVIKLLQKKAFATPGSFVVASVLSIKKKKLSGKNLSKEKVSVKKGDVVQGVICTTRKNLTRHDGSSMKWEQNGIVLLSTQQKLFGNRVLSGVPYELRKTQHTKILSLATSSL